MVLFQKYHPATKELTSPKWAFQKLEKDSVQKGADSFIAEMEEWFPDIFLVWGFNFIEAMFEKENGTYISNMVFGENFQVKDFENWSRRLQPKIKKCLFEVCGCTRHVAVFRQNDYICRFVAFIKHIKFKFKIFVAKTHVV
jgi:hypothetical protein